jgi:serine O-acetyltransferase
VPPNSVVVGVPGQTVSRSKPHHANDAPDLDHSKLPDLVGVSLVDLIRRVEVLEAQGEKHANGKPHVHVPTDGSWPGEDFSI